MTRRTLKFVVLAASLVVSDAFAQATAESMYVDAIAREETVRNALAAEPADGGTLAEIRDVVAAYEAIVRRYPASGYSDNALWQAGRLSLDAFIRFNDARDRAEGLRLLRSLPARYPTSKQAKLVPEQLGAFEESAVPPPRQAGSSALEREEGRDVEHKVSRPTVTMIKDIRRVVLSDAVRVTIELDAEVPFHEERLADPARVFVDLSSTRAAPLLLDQTIRYESDADIVRQIRIGRHPNNTTRVVLDAAGVASYSVYALYNPYRLVIDCVRAAADTAPAVRREPATPALRGRRLASEWGRRLPSVHAGAAHLLAAAHAPLESSTAASANADVPDARPELPPPAAAMSPPTKNLTGGFSIARQLGLNVSRIVIDPGHGGHDPGAEGKGLTEAELVLDIALRLEALLEKLPGVDVILTRRTDDFVPLPERTAIANREGADLFLSIHANASPHPQARGVETYFLNFANNLSEAAVAARENAASGQAMGALPDLVKTIALNNKLDESRDLATQVQRAMREKLRGSNKTLKDLGVKQAPFVVLIGAAMPSVLTEISFVTNPQEAKLLRGSPYRQRIAEALAAAIRTYQRSLKGVTAVAHQ